MVQRSYWVVIEYNLFVTYDCCYFKDSQRLLVLGLRLRTSMKTILPSFYLNYVLLHY